MYCDNPSFAFVNLLYELKSRGIVVESRNGDTRELLTQFISINKPLERFFVLKHRHDNPFAKVAETLWILAGRNDATWLSYYLPRAMDYVDDGIVWRGGYGPRLRNWDGNGLDQLKECYNILKANPTSRRAVMMLFDPDRDFTDSKDIPCNNWLSWSIRDSKLNLNIAQRSSDIMWGFSGINTFEFSTLLQVMANWLKVEVGTITWFITSLHYYTVHETKVEKILADYKFEDSPYIQYKAKIDPFLSTPDTFDRQLDAYFELEGAARGGRYDKYSDFMHHASNLSIYTNPFLYDSAIMSLIWINMTLGKESVMVDCLNNLTPNSDFRAAAIEYLTHKKVSLIGFNPTVQEIVYFIQVFGIDLRLLI